MPALMRRTRISASSATAFASLTLENHALSHNAEGKRCYNHHVAYINSTDNHKVAAILKISCEKMRFSYMADYVAIKLFWGHFVKLKNFRKCLFGIFAHYLLRKINNCHSFNIFQYTDYLHFTKS